VARRGPYMHDGSVRTLDEVIDLYDRGGLARRSGLSAEIVPLKLNRQEKDDLVEFMKTLTGRLREVVVPELPK
jgi:cytochrome c peroxidase